MKKMCTTIEQSKKLIELGIDVNTADMMWTYDFTIGQINGLNVISIQLKPEKSDIPAWSLSALLELIPKFSLEKDVSNNEGYQLHYNYDTTYYDNPVDAAFEMVVWLKENGKI